MNVKDFCPPVVLNAYRRIANKRIRFDGPFTSWSEACKNSDGYDSNLIFERVKAATELVVSGKAAFERDSMAFQQPEPHYALNATLLDLALQNNGSVDVLDFGGSLGSSFFQALPFLSNITSLKWNIIEQDHYVEAGKNLIQDPKIQFYTQLETYSQQSRPNIVLLSSTLQYLENADQQLQALMDLEPEVIVIDRTPFTNDSQHKAAVQVVPPSIYSASYPCWLLSEDTIAKILEKSYSLTSFIESPEGDFQCGPVTTSFKGMIWKRKSC